MKSYRFLITVQNGEEKSAIVVNIPVDALKDSEDKSIAAREWVRKKGIDCVWAKQKGYAYTTEDLISIRHKGKRVTR